MLNKLNDFLASLVGSDHEKKVAPPSLEVSCSVLLCEVMRADQHRSTAELDTLKTLISEQFSLPSNDVNSIMDTALALSENATDFFQFTQAINEHYSLAQRTHIVNLLWQVAYADGELASIEEHTIRRIADLLHLRDSEYVATKVNAKAKYEQ
ncbi:TerB family tellurite resistance protein [Colwellia sp. D2M02]|uniref:tellurite resistance TerB family protein n=1 Tax=Colwellia sp. D2M02 TaxID=2841562 RepID=UPI001C0A12C3|nr:TerB family tellurite resistance protein [Colwellia sp. D2M02]MBU2894186.1 TerB family tellurite resistance protein [Colwellia sp. D2M02]